MPDTGLARSRLPVPQVLRELAVFALLVASIVLPWRSNLLLLGVLLAQAVVALCFWHDARDLALFFVVAVLGSLAEVVFVRSGVLNSSLPELLVLCQYLPQTRL